jgi:hypothetical protein
LPGDTDELVKENPEKYHAPFIRVLRAMIEWAAHLTVVLGLLGGIWFVEKFIHRLWGEEGRTLFNFLPLSYIFDGADMAVLIGFLFYGVYSVIKAYARNVE